jgi:hypothetical protein
VIDISSIGTHLYVTGAILIYLVLHIVIRFFGRGVWHLFRLRSIRAALAGLPENAPVTAFRDVFNSDEALGHLWKEYQDTLHEQREERGGQMSIKAVRATVPAEVYFNPHSVVDGRVGTEFFKHFPGLFTGVGIIGTFSGLITGLHQFKVSDEPAAVRKSLEALMGDVGAAFIISGLAIATAMAVTFFEKLLLSRLYATAEAISHAVDARFESGAGEEYLSRLVKASEESASQSKMLKDALVKELGDLLREVTASQVASNSQLHARLGEQITDAAKVQVDASREGSRSLADTLDKTIRDALEGPLRRLAESVERASGDQSSAAVKMLNDVMTSFSQRLNDLFGSQISGLNDLNRQTAEAMQQAVSALHALIGNLEAKGKESTDTMAATMAEAVKSMGERQAAINAEMKGFVEQIRELTGATQKETAEKLNSTLDALGARMTALLDSLGDSHRKAREEQQSREEETATRQRDLMTNLTGSVDEAVKQMAAAAQLMAESVSTLSAVTGKATDGLTSGAARIDAAATKFSSAGAQVGGVMEQATRATAKLTEVTGAMSSSATALQDSLRDYKSQREALVSVTGNIQSIVKSAGEQALLSDGALKRIEASAKQLSAAQRDMDEYLEGVSAVLEKTTDSFGNAVVSTLARVNTAFHQKLSDSVGLLAASIHELESSLNPTAPKK